MAKMTCPICGKTFDEFHMRFLDNGNPACAECVEAEEMKMQTKSSNSHAMYSKKICGNCKSEMDVTKEFCPVCGKKYIPFVCDKCNSKIMTQTKFCPSCGNRVKSQKEKKRKKTIIISSITSALVLILTFCLILFVPYTAIKDCYACTLGKTECRAKYYTEQLSGIKVYNHDCGLCVDGYTECTACNGKGHEIVTTTNFKEWF